MILFIMMISLSQAWIKTPQWFSGHYW